MRHVKRDLFGVAVEFYNESDADELVSYLGGSYEHGTIDKFQDPRTKLWVVTQYARLIRGATIRKPGDIFAVMAEGDLEYYNLGDYVV